MKTIIADYERAALLAADRICALIAERPDAVLALSGGKSPAALYNELVKRYNSHELSLDKAKLFLVADYTGLDDDDPRLCRNEIKNALVETTDLRIENCRFIDVSNFSDYDELIAEAGGIDLCVLGIGHNAHIGFNEPATQFNTFSHRQKLTDKTRRQKVESFGGADNVPEYGVTMGIKTITQARDIIVLAFGEDKKGPVFQMLYARDDSVFPAAFLQLPLNVTVIADEAAAELL